MELAVLTWLMVKHFVADYFLQTKWMIVEKAEYGKLGGLVHAGEHAILTGVVLGIMGIGWPTLLLMVIDFILHYQIDWTKSNYLRGRFAFSPLPMDQSDYQYWWAMGLDQFGHYLTYVLIVLILGGIGAV